MSIDAAVRAQVERAIGTRLPSATVAKLPQHASSRAYYRVTNAASSWVVMVTDPARVGASDEGGVVPPTERMPFVDVQQYLHHLGVRVPQLLGHDESAGMLVLEDLGDLTFERALSSMDWRELYARALELAAQMRERARRNPDDRCIAYRRNFGRALYEWELEHFREWGLAKWSPRSLSAADEATLASAFAFIVEELDALPRGFTHRDFQSRNIMVHDGALVVIDFQDALMGPRAYDVVALLRDSYVELPSPLVAELRDVYAAAVARESGVAPDEKALSREFDLVTVHRKLKDAARFEFIHQTKQNPNFLPHIAPSMRYVREALTRLPELSALERILDAYLPADGW